MASTPTTAAVFSLTNMKPDPGEQADAIWAQKIAENDAYNYYREIRLPLITDPSGGPHQFFCTITKLASHNYLRLTMRSDATAAAAVTDTINIKADGQTLGGASTISASNAYTRGVSTTATFEVDISALVTGTKYLVVVTIDAAHGYYGANLSMIYGAGATY